VAAAVSHIAVAPYMYSKIASPATPDRSSLSAAHERNREVPIGRTNCDTSVIHTVCLIGGYFDRVRMLIPLAMPIITNRRIMLTSRSTEVIRNQLIMTSIGKEYRYCVN